MEKIKEVEFRVVARVSFDASEIPKNIAEGIYRLTRKVSEHIASREIIGADYNTVLGWAKEHSLPKDKKHISSVNICRHVFGEDVEGSPRIKRAEFEIYFYATYNASELSREILTILWKIMEDDARCTHNSVEYQDVHNWVLEHSLLPNKLKDVTYFQVNGFSCYEDTYEEFCEKKGITEIL